MWKAEKKMKEKKRCEHPTGNHVRVTYSGNEYGLRDRFGYMCVEPENDLCVCQSDGSKCGKQRKR